MTGALLQRNRGTGASEEVEREPLAVIERADQLYRDRARAGAVEESVALLTRAVSAGSLFETQWRLARAFFFLGQAAGSTPSKQRLHGAGIEAGRRAVSLDRTRVEGRFWLGVNLALFAEASTGIRAARALIGARRELQRATRLSESYHGAGPLRVLARIEHKAPWFLGGSRERSRRLFERAIERAPNNGVTLLYAAELAIEQRERGRALALLQTVISQPIDPEWEFENHRDRRIARDLLDQLQP